MKACKKFIALGFVSFSFTAGGFCQNAISAPAAPKAPVVTAPSMPTVTPPTIGSGYYLPGSNGFYSGVKKSSRPAPNAPETPSAPSVTKTAAPSLTASISKSQAASALNGLTADDLNGLNNLGLLSSFTGLLGSNKQESLSGSTDTMLLEQILKELNDVKEKVGQVSIQQASSQPAAAASNPKILRFVINGFDINSSCRKVFFSSQESDGSFLLTADRKYMADSEPRSETFYLLFRAKGNSSGVTQYTVTPEILQDKPNSTSMVYKLCAVKNLTATRTGNMVKMTGNLPDLKLDLLLSLD